MKKLFNAVNPAVLVAMFIVLFYLSGCSSAPEIIQQSDLKWDVLEGECGKEYRAKTDTPAPLLEGFRWETSHRIYKPCAEQKPPTFQEQEPKEEPKQ